jgi:hypothetical protein
MRYIVNDPLGTLNLVQEEGTAIECGNSTDALEPTRVWTEQGNTLTVQYPNLMWEEQDRLPSNQTLQRVLLDRGQAQLQ